MKKNKKRMLITGVSGMLGNNLAYYFRDHYDVRGWFCSHHVAIEGVRTRKVDISRGDSIDKEIASDGPDIVIHCASLTDIDFCEQHKELTKLVNVTGTERLIKACKDKNIKFVYISTDAVYDGKKGNYRETDVIDPCNYYGVTKYEGEKVTLQLAHSLVLRTNIFGWNILEKHSVAEWILYELMWNRSIKGFQDAYFSSIYTFEFARLLESILQKDLCGLYNCASSTSLSKYEFAHQLAKRFELKETLIHPIDIEAFPFFAKRGKNLTLNTDKLTKDLKIKLPTIQECLDRFHRDYENGFAHRIKNSQYRLFYPELDRIPYGRQAIDEEDIVSVIQVMKSSNLTQGKKVDEFQRALCDFTGARYAVAFNSGTSALHCACLAAGITAGDEAITSTNTFVASANCVVYCGAKPVFADIDEKTYNIDPDQIAQKVTPRTKVVIPVHFAGQSADMGSIRDIVRKKEQEYGHKIYIIEDASHALGSCYKGVSVGSCTYSDMAVMSFHPVKHITTGEGGVVLTNEEEFYKRLLRYRSHGVTNDPQEFIYREQACANGIINPWYYEQQLLGHNYRITDLQCALGLSQLKKMPFFMRRRRELTYQYNKAFRDTDFLQTPCEAPQCSSNWHLYVLCIDFTKLEIGRTQVMKALKENGILTQVHYIPVHTQPFFRTHFNTEWGDCPHAEEYYRKCLSIPLFPAMTEVEMERVIDDISSITKDARRKSTIRTKA